MFDCFYIVPVSGYCNLISTQLMEMNQIFGAICIHKLKNWLVGINDGLELRSGLFPVVWDSYLSPETHHNFHHVRRGWLLRFSTPRGIIWMGIWRTLYSRRILHATSAISVHGRFSPGEPLIRVIQSRVQNSTHLATVAPGKKVKSWHFSTIYSTYGKLRDWWAYHISEKML